MKITACLMLFTALAVSASSVAQKITLNERKSTIQSVFKNIHDQTGYDFFYNDDLFDQVKTINVKLQDASIEQTLKEILKGYPIAYEIYDRTVLIKLLQTPVVKRSEPSIDIKGSVKDSLGHPVSGVTVKLTPGKFVTATDNKGLFNFKKVAKGSYLITVTCVGFQTLEKALVVDETSNASTLSLVIKEMPSQLEEVTINTGYQLIKPEQSTGSTARIGTKDYESRINTDFLSGLTNRLPGLLINSDINFEGNPLFQIRGLSTINGSKSPLIVIDGYPTELKLDMINPNEIKSVTVLKDAAAATVYGVRASNGVIIIERKKAEQGKPHIDFRTTFGISPKTNYNRYRWDPNASDIIINFERATYNPTTASAILSTAGDVYSGFLYNFSPSALITLRQYAGQINGDQANQQLGNLSSYNNSADYSKLFLRSAQTQTYNLNVNRDNENALYYITLNYTNNAFQQKRNDYNRILLSARSSFNFSKKLSLELTTDFFQSNSLVSPIPDINAIYPYERFQDTDGKPLPIYSNSNANPLYNQSLMGLGLQDNRSYPLTDLSEVNTHTRTLNNRITANFKYVLGNGFDISFGGLYENSNNNSRSLASAQSTVVRQLLNRYTQVDPNSGANIFNLPVGGYLQQTSQQTSSYTGRAQLKFNKYLGKKHSINAILGAEIRNITNQSNSAPYFGYNDKSLLQAPINYGTIFSGSFNSPYALNNPGLSFNQIFNQFYEENRYLSGYSNVVYSFLKKYSLTGSIRIDQSNLFGTDPKYKYKPLWSIGAGWNINEEKFMRNVTWLKQLKLRAAYGFNGNVAKLSLPQVIATAGYNNLYPINTNPVQMLSLFSYANKSLRWEETQNRNLGIDFGILRNITGSIDFYDKKSTDLLAVTQIDASRGGQSALLNTASIDNRGLEIALHADWITKRHFNWNTGFVFSRNTGKVLDVYNSTLTPNSGSVSYITPPNSNYLKGYPVGAIFQYRLAGVNTAGKQLVYANDGSSHVLLAPDGKINDLYYAGTSIPPVNIGLSNRVDIGRFYVYVMINYYGGFKVKAPMPNPDDFRPLNGAGNYWKKAGDENIPDVLPDVTTINSFGSYLNNSDRYIVPGDYFTLSDITASYNFSSMSFFKRANIKQFEIKFQASNLYTVALNKYNYSLATGSFAKSYITPVYTIGLFTNF